MRTSPSMAGRLVDDAPGSGSGPSRFEWGEVRQLPAPRRPEELPPLRTTQAACYEALTLALTEGQVFAALTGPEGSGKTTVLEAVIADRRDRVLRCIRIPDPDKVPAALAEQIEQVAYAEASKPENLQRHVVLAVDDAHLSSPELLTCLSRVAAMREPGRRVPQVLLVGRPELWTRLAEPTFEPLARRVAIRATLPAVGEDSDPWEAVEDGVKETMTQLRPDADGGEVLPPQREAPFRPSFDFDEPRSRPELAESAVPPSSVYALFPDPPPPPPRSSRGSRSRLVMPMAVLAIGLVGCVVALSMYDWPDMLGDMPWSNAKPATPFVMPRSLQESSHGLPMAPISAPPRQTAEIAPAPVAPSAPPPAPVQSAPPPPAPAPAVAEAPVQAPAPVQPPKETVRAPETTVASVAPQAVAPVAAPVATPVVVAPPPPAPPVATVSPAPTQTASVAAPVRAASPAPSLSPSLLTLLLHRGDEQVSIGDISAARLLYERVAESGSAIAARQLARTYDPAFLTTGGEGGLADPASARKWYAKAAALGDAEAAARLKALNQGQ